MIDFTDVRRESEPTFLFFARSLRTALEYALKECQITGWQIMTRKEAQQYLPADFQIPEVRISPGAPRIEKSVLVFVSYYNQDDMARKLLEIQGDSDILAWRNAGGRRVMKACLLEEKFLKDPAPFHPFAPPAIEENKAQISGVRRGEEPTFFWFPRQYEADLVHHLEEHDTTGWAIAADPESIWHHLPDGCVIPDKLDGLAAFISYFDPDDMHRKLDEILSSEDNAAWHRKCAELSAHMLEYKQSWIHDPPPFSEIVRDTIG